MTLEEFIALLLILGGFQYLTAGSSSKDAILYAVIGLSVVIMSYAILQ